MASPFCSNPWSTLRVFLIALQAALIPLSATAADFYVNPSTGSNGNNGLTSATAWKTITFAMTQIPAGATVNLASGVYDVTSGEVFPIMLRPSTALIGLHFHVSIIRNDQSTKETLYFIASNGQGISLKNLSVIGGRGGFRVEGLSPTYSIDSCSFAKTAYMGVWADLSSAGSIKNSVFVENNDVAVGFANASIENSIVSSNHGRGIWGTNIQIKNSVIVGTGRQPTTSGDGIAIDGKSSVINCLVAGNDQAGMLMSTTESSIRNNVISRNHHGVFIFSSFSDALSNNLVIGNRDVGIFELSLESDPSLKNNILYNNRIGYIDDNAHSYNTEFEINSLVGNGTAVVENNLVADPLFIGGPFGTNSSIQYDSNSFQSILTDSSAQWEPDKFKGAILYPHIDENTFAYYILENDTTTVRVWGDITDASFAATVVGATYEIVDYHLSRFSLAVDSGYTAGVDLSDLDLDGNPRVAGSGVDIGAYEFAQLPVLPSPTVTPTPTTTPTSTATATVTNTNTEIPTWTPLPTYTPYPTYTEAPTCEPVTTQAPGDLTGDGVTDAQDLLELLIHWKQ